jgi:protoheme IX farnesyltransferase
MTPMTVASPRSAVSPGEIVGLFKPRIAVSIMLSAVGGMAISPGPRLAPSSAIGLAVGVLLAAGAAGAFNQWAEADLDARMERTANRPFASGRLVAGPAWLSAIVAVLVLACALAGWTTNAWAALYTFLGAFTYAVVYTLWLKRRTWLNIVVGGLAGSFAVLAGAAAIDPGLSAGPIVLAVVLFLWTPPHFWSLAIAARKDYQSGAVPMLPIVVGDAWCARIILAHTAVLSLAALIPVAYGMGWLYLAFAVAGGAVFTWTSIMLVRDPSRRSAIRNFLASLLQLVLLLAGIVLERFVLDMSV